MRIRHIIIESLKLPVKRYDLFILVFIIALICRTISNQIYTLNIGQFSIITMITDSIISLILLGMMMNITYHAIFDNRIRLNLKETFMEGLKEYIITLYYIIMTFLFTSLFIIPTGVYSRLMHIHEYIIRLDINTTFLTIHELSHQLPVNLQLNLQHSLQLNLLIAIIIFIIFSSFGFIGKILLKKTGKIRYALNIRVILMIIRNIGIYRYIKFLICIGIITILLFNSTILLGCILQDYIISAFLESFILFFATNAFYLFYMEKASKI